ncbi:pyrimidine utilization protein D [Pseudomonas silvicola]|nr:pyrimidine utilization protein D [Pseudomonas silvicola]
MYYEWLGRSDPHAPVLVLSSGLGGSARFWDPQLTELGERFRVLVYDHAGSGRSPATLPEGYSIATMAAELLALLDQLEVSHCHFMGHALGGLVGLELALQRPALLRSQVLVNAWSSPNPHSARCFAVRKNLLNHSGPAAYVQAQALFLYPADWIAANSAQLAEDDAHALAHFPDPANLLKRIAALQAFNVDAHLARIHTPTLLLANRDDMLVPWQRSQVLADGLPNGRLHVLDYGGHASSVSDSATFNRVVLQYLAEHA